MGGFCIYPFPLTPLRILGGGVSNNIRSRTTLIEGNDEVTETANFSEQGIMIQEEPHNEIRAPTRAGCDLERKFYVNVKWFKRLIIVMFSVPLHYFGFAIIFMAQGTDIVVLLSILPAWLILEMSFRGRTGRQNC